MKIRKQRISNSKSFQKSEKAESDSEQGDEIDIDDVDEKEENEEEPSKVIECNLKTKNGKSISIKKNKLIIEEKDISETEIFQIKEYRKDSTKKYEGKPVSIFHPNSKKYWNHKNGAYAISLNENEYKFDALYSKRDKFGKKDKDEMISLMLQNDDKSVGVTEKGNITISKKHKKEWYRFQIIKNPVNSTGINHQKQKKLKQTTLTQLYPSDDSKDTQQSNKNQTTLTQYYQIQNDDKDGHKDKKQSKKKKRKKKKKKTKKKNNIEKQD